MTKSLLILTPDAESASYYGRWPYVLDAYREALAGIDVEIFDQAMVAAARPATYDLICAAGRLGLSYPISTTSAG